MSYLRRFDSSLDPLRLARAVQRTLRVQGWKLMIDSNLRQRYERSNEQPVLRNSVVPVLRTNVIGVSIPEVTVVEPRSRFYEGIDVRFPVLEGSRVRIEAPEHAIGQTFPRASSEDTRRANKHQVLTVPLDETTPEIELDVRSAPFRNEVMARASDLTVWAPFGWLVAAIIVLANEAFRDLLRRTFTRLRASRSDSGSRNRPGESD
jgi:hypothetical protein